MPTTERPRKNFSLDGAMDTQISRRTLAKGAAWSVPAIALAVASPAYAASGIVDLGAYQINGSCGTLGVLGPGFTLTAGATHSLPAGTTITISGSGVANIGTFSVSGTGEAVVNVLGGTSRQVTLTSDLPAGSTIAFRTTLSISVGFTLSALVTPPSGFIATGAKPTGSVSATLILCAAN